MTEPPLRAAIVGAGPSGFYAAGQLLAVDDPEFAVDLYDRLPTPYGLVRSGVAPDHPKIKSVTRAYDKTTQHERFQFFGHVELGSDITRRAAARPLPRRPVHARHLDRPAARDPGGGAARLACRHRVRRLVQRPPRPLGAGGRPAGDAGGRRRSRQRRDRRRADARAGTVGARGHRYRGPRDRRAAGQRHRGDHDPRPPRSAAGGVHESRAARDGRARARPTSRSSAASWTSCRPSRSRRPTRPGGGTSRSCRSTRRGRRPESRSPSASASSPLRSSCSATRTATSAA